jgi:hypothetical protein
MLVIDSLTYPEDYLEIMETSRIDDAFLEALGRLTIEEREFLADVMANRAERRKSD